MRLSTKSRYGVRAIFDIAYHAGGLPTQIKEISRRQDIKSRRRKYYLDIFNRVLYEKPISTGGIYALIDEESVWSPGHF